MVCKKIMFVGVAALALVSAAAHAGESKFSGEVFGDIYWIAADHDSAIVDMNGLWFRRIYMTYDNKFDDAFSARVRLEAVTPGDFKTKDVMIAFVKDAWLKWTTGNQAVLLGLSPTPTWSLVEDVWGLRFIEKVPAELQRLGASRDMGIAGIGSFGASKKLGYHAMIGNGTSQIGDTDAKKKVYGALRFRPTEAWALEVYADYEDRVDSGDRQTFHGFVGYKGKKMRAGVQYISQTRKETGLDIELQILSAFLTKAVSDKTWLYARVDRNFDANPEGNRIPYIPFDPTAPNYFVLAGVDWWVRENVGFSPNVEMVFYDEPEIAGLPIPDTDVIPRFTFHFTF